MWDTNYSLPQDDAQVMYVSIVTQGDLEGKKKKAILISNFLIFQSFAYSHLQN